MAALAIASIPRPTEAQVEQRLTAPPEFTLNQWTTADGLPQNSVNAIAQTPDGYIWAGTFGGLARFDGLRFNVVERVDSAGRHVDRVLSLAVAPDSSLWIGTENGLLHYRAGRFVRFTQTNGLPDYEITALYFDHTGTLWIGTEHGGAVRYDGKQFVRVREANGVPFDDVVSFKEDHAGVMWINARGHFLTLDPPHAASEAQLVAGHHFDIMLLEDRDSTKWFRQADGVAHVRSDGIHVFRIGFGPEVMIDQTRAGRYWLGTYGNGILELHADGSGNTSTYPLASGKTNYGTRALLDGHDGNVWAGTMSDGLLRLKRNLFTTYRKANGLSHNVATSVMEDRDGGLWIGTNCAGVNLVDRTRQTVRTYLGGDPGPGNDPCVFALTQDSTGAIWVGTYGGGLTRIENGVATRLGGLGVLRDSTILALYTDRKGTLWVGTNAAGLAEVRDGRVQRLYSTANGLAHNSVRTISQTRDGTLWIGTLEGLSRLDASGHLTTYGAKDGLSSEYVRAIYEDDDGSLWIGTYGGGLNRMRDGRFVPVRRSDGLPDNVVSSITDDGRGNLWMTGNRGIFRVAKEQLRRFTNGELHRVHSVLYDQGDGLVNAETNGGFQPAAWKDHTGRLWFPTIDGLASVDPASAVAAPRPSPVTIEEVIVDGEAVSPSQSLEIGPGRPNVEFRYTAVSLSSPENETFRYRLKSFDEDWVESGTRRIAYYSRLPAGHYRFVVTAANRDGAWNPVETGMDLVVLAPIYMRAWFVSAMVILVALGLWIAHAVALRTRSDAIRDERSRLAREIHDSLLQGFGGIVLQLHAASARLSLSPAQQPLLDRVLATIDRTLAEARAAVWDIRPADPVHSSLLVECENAAQRIHAGSPTQVRVEALGRARPLSAAAQTECLKIVEEALTNVRKHADAAHATVELNYGWRRLCLTISDDGKGFDADRDGNRPGHWGWLGMRERASRVGARLILRSTPGAGTVVRVDVPYYVGLLTWLRRARLKD